MAKRGRREPIGQVDLSWLADSGQFHPKRSVEKLAWSLETWGVPDLKMAFLGSGGNFWFGGRLANACAFGFGFGFGSPRECQPGVSGNVNARSMQIPSSRACTVFCPSLCAFRSAVACFRNKELRLELQSLASRFPGSLSTEPACRS